MDTDAEDEAPGPSATKTEAVTMAEEVTSEPRGPISGYSALSDEAVRLLEGVGLVPCRRLLGCLTVVGCSELVGAL